MKAFPFLHKHPTTGETTLSHGMELRDYFAGQALTLFQRDCFLRDDEMSQYATLAYQMADEMMKARENKHE
jgi:hypothetical protein